MHIGSYDDEPAMVAMMHEFMEKQGYKLDITDKRLHHEIYLSDARKVAPEKLFGRRPVDASALTSVATNQDLIERLQQRVKETDLTERAGLDEFRTFYQSVMKPAYDAQYPDEMRSDSKSAIDLDFNGSEGVMKLVEFAKKWLELGRVY